MADNTAVPLNRIERLLAFMIATAGGLSVLAILAIVIATVTKVDTSEGVWLPVGVLPAVGLPIAFILIVVFSIVAIMRRRRLNGGQ